MHRIRYYTRLIEPHYFQRGVRGWWIRALNRLRLQLECHITRHVLHYLAQEDGRPRQEQQHLRQLLQQDIKEEVAKCTTPPVPLTRVLDEPLPTHEVPRPAAVGSRLRTEHLMARLTQDKRRQRYTRRAPVMGDPEGDFEPLAPVANNDDLPTMEVLYARGEKPPRTVPARTLRRDGAP